MWVEPYETISFLSINFGHEMVAQFLFFFLVDKEEQVRVIIQPDPRSLQTPRCWCPGIGALEVAINAELYDLKYRKEWVSSKVSFEFLQCSLVCDPLVQVISAALSERKVAGSIPDDSAAFHTVGPCKNAVSACWVTVVK